MEQYSVTGMSCAACSARVEKAVLEVKGVNSCSVSLLTNSMGVDGTASSQEIIAAVRNAGYDAVLKKDRREHSEGLSLAEDELQDMETPILKKRLLASLGFWLVLMYVSMGHMMWGWPLPSFFQNNHIAMGILQLLLTVIIMVINQRFFISGIKSILHGAPNMDALVTLGSIAAFCYSVFALFAMTDVQLKGDEAAVMAYMNDFYFESAATILTLITLGKMLEARSKGKTTDAIKGLMKLAPKTATILQDGKETVVPVDRVKKGDVFVLRPGENIPVDGIVLEGNSAVDEATLTGESIPVDKAVGSQVFAGTNNQSGYLRCRATKVGEDTTLSQIIQMVRDASTTKAPIAKVADKVSGVFVPVVIGIGIGTVAVWLLAGQSVGFALARGISVLVISCPCALGLATPVAIMVGNGMGAKNGILFKTAVSLEEMGKADIVVLDKTGTITRGEPTVTDMIPVEGKTEQELLELAFSLEKKSEHPLAKAICKQAQQEGLTPHTVTDFQALPGNGLTAFLNGNPVYGGNYQYIMEQMPVPEEIKEKSHFLSEEGKTPLFFACNGEFYGMIVVADTIKEDSPAAIKELKEMGLRVVMLTGDNRRTANAIGEKAGVDEVIADVLPDGKERAIRQLQQNGKVIMVGDGMNDAPALTSADVGVAIGAGTDVAIDAADVVLVKSNLSDVPAGIRLSRATLRNIHENLFWAFIYNTIGIPLAAGVLIPVLGWQLNPAFAAAAMSLSSFSVVTNALRLNLLQIHDAKGHLNKKQKNIKENKMMRKTLKIEGMMCGHCEMHTKKALEALEGVTEAEVSYQTGTAVVTLEKEVSDELLKQAVTDQGYTVLDVQ
ncbi:MAG: heavy metal translocating P-type ATPase [Lachnospiraceae bacterium]